MTYSCHDGFCGAEDCQTCHPSSGRPDVCPTCGEQVWPSRMMTCQSCGNDYCVDCLDGDFVCNECKKESEGMG